MSNHRMFSSRLVDSAKFLKMSHESQLLYFHLGMRADDDGVVEAFTTIRLIGSEEKDLDELVSKGYVRILNEDLVAYITDWRKNNTIRADRKTDTIYKDLLLHVVPDADLLEAKPRSDGKQEDETTDQLNGGHRTGDGPSTDGISQAKPSEASSSHAIPGEAKQLRCCGPSREEVRAYAKEIGAVLDPDAFFDRYEAKGWADVKGNPIRDWKALFKKADDDERKIRALRTGTSGSTGTIGPNGVAILPENERLHDLDGIID